MLKGYPTIGVGTLLSLPGGITKEESRYLLNNRIRSARVLLLENLPWAAEQPEAVLDVMIEMVFQLGIYGFLQFTATLKCIHYGHYAAAADSMLASKWASQTPSRVRELASIIRSHQPTGV